MDQPCHPPWLQPPRRLQSARPPPPPQPRRRCKRRCKRRRGHRHRSAARAPSSALRRRPRPLRTKMARSSESAVASAAVAAWAARDEAADARRSRTRETHPNGSERSARRGARETHPNGSGRSARRGARETHPNGSGRSARRDVLGFGALSAADTRTAEGWQAPLQAPCPHSRGFAERLPARSTTVRRVCTEQVYEKEEGTKLPGRRPVKGPLRHATRKCVRRGPRARARHRFGFRVCRGSPRSAGRYSRACAGRLRYHPGLHGFTIAVPAVPGGTDLCAPVRCDLLWMSGRCGPESGPGGARRRVWRIEAAAPRHRRLTGAARNPPQKS